MDIKLYHVYGQGMGLYQYTRVIILETFVVSVLYYYYAKVAVDRLVKQDLTVFY